VDEAKSSLAIVANGKLESISFAEEGFFSTRATRKSATLTAPLVFVGYGLKVPEKNLDELAGLDLTGKIVVYLAGSPADIPTSLARALSRHRRTMESVASCRRRRPDHYLQSCFDGTSRGRAFL